MNVLVEQDVGSRHAAECAGFTLARQP
jgi:hypothetical protein